MPAVGDYGVFQWILSTVVQPTFLAGMGCGICVAWALRRNTTLKHLQFQNTPIECQNSCSDDGDYKMVLVVRTDLKMGKGKAAAQCSHAAVMAYRQCLERNPDLLTGWKESGQAKVVLKTDSESSLLELARSARQHGLFASVVRDAGRTQVDPGSKTVLGVGPGPSDVVDQVTGHLKLY